MSELKRLAGTCEFTSEQLSDSLRVRFICGLRSEQTKRKLLSANFTFQEAVDAAIAQEIAQKDVRDLGANSQGENSFSGVNKVKRDNQSSRGRWSGRRRGGSGKQPQKTGDHKNRCFRCGLTNHKYKDSECFKCHRTGHLQSESRNEKPPSKRMTGKRHVHHTNLDSEAVVSDASADEFPGSIFNLEESQKQGSRKSGLSAPAVKVPVLIEDANFQMEVDTGAAVSILNYSDYERHFKYLALKPVEKSFHDYAGTPLDVAGQILVDVVHNGQRATLPLLVVRARCYAPPLLGRSWRIKIRLDWANLFPSTNGQFAVGQDTDSRVEGLKELYAEVFKPELGTVKGVTAKLHLKENATVFQRARPVPYALRSAETLKRKFKRMESEGVLRPVEVSDWATPIVCVPKTDGSVRICGDYKGTVNPAIQTEQFLISTLEEIRGRVSSWKKFTNIDLRSAYQQLVLDEEAQKLCTINTHKGLFRYTRLPFGISSSSAIWQRFIEQVLAGLDGTCVIMDDLLVGGSNDDEHLKNLEAVLKQFLKYGLRVKLPKCVFMSPSVIYFGLRYSENGLQPMDEKVKGHQGGAYPKQRVRVTILLRNVSDANQLYSQIINPCPSSVSASRK